MDRDDVPGGEEEVREEEEGREVVKGRRRGDEEETHQGDLMGEKHLKRRFGLSERCFLHTFELTLLNWCSGFSK